MTGAVNSQGDFKIETSRAIQAYRERVGHDPKNLWFAAAPMDGVNGSVVSFAEKVLLEQYVRTHGRLPVCDTAAGHLWKPAEPRRRGSAGTEKKVGARRAPVVEDAHLEALCTLIAARHGLAFKVVEMTGGREPWIALGQQANGDLAGIAVRAIFKPTAREVEVFSKLQPAAARAWGEPKPHPQPSAMKSVLRFEWPLKPEAFEELVLASVDETRASLGIKTKPQGTTP